VRPGRRRPGSKAATAGPRWVVDGSYINRVGSLWSRADMMIWLDLQSWVVLPRLVRRSVLRIILRTVGRQP